MNAAPRKPQRKKPEDEAKDKVPVQRTFNGQALDVRTGAAFLGSSQKMIYSQVARRTIPFRRLGGRIVFVKSELEAWLQGLPGCSLDEARANQAARAE